VTGSLPSEIERLCSDRLRGSSALLVDFLKQVEKLGPDQLRSSLKALQQAFPVMAVWYFLEQRLLTDELNLAELKSELSTARESALAMASQSLAGVEKLLTISNSSLVTEALTSLPSDQRPAVIIGKGRPAEEGVQMSRLLNQAGFQVDLVEDWELLDRVRDVDLVMTGADVVSNTGFVNKQGTGELVTAAWASQVPFVVVAEAFKHIPDWHAPESAYYQPGTEAAVHKQKIFEWIPGLIVDGVVNPK